MRRDDTANLPVNPTTDSLGLLFAPPILDTPTPFAALHNDEN